MTTKLDLNQLKISESQYLNDLQKTVCPQCNRPRRIYCKWCCIPLDHIPPKVKLPLTVDIWRHPAEAEGKSTTVQLKILANDDVNLKIVNLSNDNKKFFDYLNEINKNEDNTDNDGAKKEEIENILILYPSNEAISLKNIKNLNDYKRLIVLDGTWSQCNSMINSILFKKGKHDNKTEIELTHTISSSPNRKIQLQPIKIEEYETLFWRYQAFGNTFLSTIEAVYWFLIEYNNAQRTEYLEGNFDAEKSINELYNVNKYDDLLFYFKFHYDLIQKEYKNKPERKFHSGKQNYIQYN